MFSLILGGTGGCLIYNETWMWYMEHSTPRCLFTPLLLHKQLGHYQQFSESFNSFCSSCQTPTRVMLLLPIQSSATPQVAAPQCLTQGYAPCIYDSEMLSRAAHGCRITACHMITLRDCSPRYIGI